MNNYLVDRGALEKFVDMLIGEKYPGQNYSQSLELATLRERSIGQLDRLISENYLKSLSEMERAELEQLIDRGESDPSVFQIFFRNSNIEASINGTLRDFRAEFLKGGADA